MQFGPLVYKNAGLRYCELTAIFALFNAPIRVTKPKYALQQTCLRGFDILPHDECPNQHMS